MIKTYLKQAWELLKQNKLFSTLYIVGTGLSIAMTMIIAIVYYVRIAPVYPEINRSRTMVIRTAQLDKEKSMLSSSMSYAMMNEWIYSLKSAELVTGIYTIWGDDAYVQVSGSNEEISALVKYTDENFFRVFPFTFLDGKPFTQADRRNGIRSAVLTESYARRIFGTAQGVVGKVFSLSYTDVKVVGIARGGSFLTPASYAQIYLPYSCVDNYDKGLANTWALGRYNAYILVKETADMADVRVEVDELVRKYNTSDISDGWTLSLANSPEAYWHSTFRTSSNSDVAWNKVIGTFAGMLLVLLLVPALNLSGMISTRMERRLPEMGVRKAFGASRGLLLRQVLWENMLLSGLGALLGLVLAWIALVVSGHNTFSLFEAHPTDVPPGADVWLGVDMLFAPVVFAVAVLFCFLLNLLSALIPAWQSLRHPITASLNEQK